MYVKIENDTVIKYPYTNRDLKSDNPKTSFPSTITDDTRAAFGVHPVQTTDKPSYDPDTQKLEQGTPVKQVSDWVQVWNVVDLTQEEIDQRRQAKVPRAVSKRKGRQQMIIAGIYDQVQPLIDAIQDDTERALMQSYFDDSTEYERQHPAMIQMLGAMGLTATQADQLFIDANELD